MCTLKGFMMIMMLFDTEQTPNYKCWANSVKILFEKLGFYYVWLYQGVRNESLFVLIVNQRL